MIPRCRSVNIRLCTQQDFTSTWLYAWAKTMGMGLRLHRKIWELAAIIDSVHRAGFTLSGFRGLGFGVGTEPLTSQFAAMGCRITATDLDPHSPEVAKWAPDNQHAAMATAIHHSAICSRAQFDSLVDFRAVDMRSIPADLHGQYDFVWSCSALEHLGSLAAGARFMIESMKCLRPGGVAVHTTEFNASSDIVTLDHGTVVVFRRRDIEPLLRGLVVDGGRFTADWHTGHGAADLNIDEAPYRAAPHLKLRLGGVTLMSMLLVMTRE